MDVSILDVIIVVIRRASAIGRVDFGSDDMVDYQDIVGIFVVIFRTDDSGRGARGGGASVEEDAPMLMLMLLLLLSLGSSWDMMHLVLQLHDRQ